MAYEEHSSLLAIEGRRANSVSGYRFPCVVILYGASLDRVGKHWHVAGQPSWRWPFMPYFQCGGFLPLLPNNWFYRVCLRVVFPQQQLSLAQCPPVDLRLFQPIKLMAHSTGSH